MYCHHCHKDFAEDAIYCSQCGRKLLQHNITNKQKVGIWPNESIDPSNLELEQSYERDESASVVTHSIPTNKHELKHHNFTIKVIIGFVVLLVIISSILFHSYKVELDQNEHVLELQSNAKVAALSGDYQQALTLLEEAIALRPHYQALVKDQDIVYDALKLDRLSEELNATIEAGKESEAEVQLEQLRQELNGNKEPIFDKHREELEELNLKYTILSLTGELSSISTINDLGNLLNVVNGLIGEEAEALRNQIIDRIRTTATAEVNDLLTKKKFTVALSTTEEALAWVRTDEVLQDLKQRVKQEQAAYELAEQERIQKAMEEAAAEDYINQTAAIELINHEKVMNELGNIVVVAYLKNVATRSIYDISVNYKITDAADQVIAEGTAEVTPNYVASGEGMSFSLTLPENIQYEDELSVEITDGKWSLE